MASIALYFPPMRFSSGQSIYLSSMLCWKISALSSSNSSISSLFQNILYLFSGILLFKNKTFAKCKFIQMKDIPKQNLKNTSHFLITLEVEDSNALKLFDF